MHGTIIILITTFVGSYSVRYLINIAHKKPLSSTNQIVIETIHPQKITCTTSTVRKILHTKTVITK